MRGAVESDRPRQYARVGEVWFVAAVLFAASLALFLIDLGSPDHVYFDETWYVPTAQEWLANGNLLHPEHPPLAKLLISASVYLFGDTPFGWRALSAVFGAVTLVGVYLWTLALSRNIRAALWAAAMTFVDQILYVQARIAMLDVYLFAFVTLALAGFSYALTCEDERRARLAAIAGGAAFGLAGACKLSGFFPLAGMIALFAVVFAVQQREGAARCPPGLWAVLSPLTAIGCLVVAPALAYLACYAPLALKAHSFLYLFTAQREMLHIMLGHSAGHPYAALWWSWPVEWRPIWYLFDAPDGKTELWDDDNMAAAVVALVNPVVLALGEAAIVWAVWRALQKRDLAAAIVAVAFFSQWAPWIVNPKGLEFFYYFFPSVLCLGPAMALYLFQPGKPRREIAAAPLLVVAGAMLLFFLPVLEASLGVSPDDLDQRTWISTWR